MSALAEAPATARPVLDGERLALIRDIHDGPIQDLFAIALTLDRLAEEHGDDVRNCAETVRGVLTKLRAILDEATPVREQPGAGERSLRALVESLREAPGAQALDVDLDALATAPPSFRQAVVAFVAEGVRNARKHADPTWVDVTATVESGVLRITVENDGPRPALDDRGIGIRLLELDADRFGGSVSARRSEDTWQLTLTLPVADLS